MSKLRELAEKWEKSSSNIKDNYDGQYTDGCSNQLKYCAAELRAVLDEMAKSDPMAGLVDVAKDLRAVAGQLERADLAYMARRCLKAASRIEAAMPPMGKPTNEKEGA